MRTNSFVKPMLVIAAIGTLMGVGGFAIATFVQSTTAGPVAGSSESFSASPSPARKLTDAVTLRAYADIRCQAMTFHTTWTARFEAVR